MLVLSALSFEVILRIKMIKTKQTLPYLALILLCLLCYLPGMSTLPIMDQDSAHFAQATKQMLETHDYTTVNFQNKARHLKPPGIYWLQAAAVKTFSTTESTNAWAYRLSSLLGGLLSVLALFGLSRKIVGTPVAFIASALLVASLLLIIESHLVVTDAVLLFTMVVMQISLWRIYLQIKQQQAINWVWPLLFWAAMAAGVLIKGITPLVGFATIMGLCLVEKRINWVKHLKPLQGFSLLIVLTLAWLIPLSLAGHSNFLLDMFRGDALPKLTHGQQSHGFPPGFFLMLLPLMFWPASIFLGFGAVYAWRERAQINTKFLLAWLIPSWLIFALIPTKLPEYVLPLYPAVALLCALGLQHIKEFTLANNIVIRTLYGVWIIYSALFITAIIFVSLTLSQHIQPGAWCSIIVVALMVFIIPILLLKKQNNAAVFAAVVGVIMTVTFLYQNVLPSLNNLWISKHVAQVLQQKMPHIISAQNPLIAVDYTEPSLVFYLGTHNVVLTGSYSNIKKLLLRPNEISLISNKHEALLNQRAKQLKLTLKPIANITGYDYVHGHWKSLELIKSVVDHTTAN